MKNEKIEQAIKREMNSCEKMEMSGRRKHAEWIKQAFKIDVSNFNHYQLKAFIQAIRYYQVQWFDE
jgi:hypothetical protein